MNAGTSEIVVYETDCAMRLEVRLVNNTVWLSQKQMAELFGCSSDNIGLHLKHIFSEAELEESATTEDFSVVRQEGSRQVTRRVRMYNLEVVISVGFRGSLRSPALRHSALSRVVSRPRVSNVVPWCLKVYDLSNRRC